MDRSEEDIDFVDAECKEVTENDCYFSSDPSNCSDWIVSLIRLRFKDFVGNQNRHFEIFVEKSS